MIQDVKILRKLAREYFTLASDEKNLQNISLHKAVNDLKMIRPVVLIDELPWSEMNINNELTVQCSDNYLKTIEWYLRSQIYRKKYLPGDMILFPYMPVQKVIRSTGIGIEVSEEIIQKENNNIVSHSYNDILAEEADLNLIQNPVIHYDSDETYRRYNLLGEIIGDIVPVKLQGIDYFSVVPWDDIARYRGVTNLLMDLIERPEFMHKIMQRLTETHLSYLEQVEALGIFDNNPNSLHCTSIHTDHLPGQVEESGQLTRKNVWGRGAAQIFASVSKEMHDEFDIEYMKQTVGQCGLVYYGCCEPLDKKIDIIEKIPNLRKISITPWADVDIAAEAINKKYVLASKPTPSAVAVPNLDREQLKKEIQRILDACARNGCSCDIVLKDISTCLNRPENIFEWEKTVMDMVKSY